MGEEELHSMIKEAMDKAKLQVDALDAVDQVQGGEIPKL